MKSYYLCRSVFCLQQVWLPRQERLELPLLETVSPEERMIMVITRCLWLKCSVMITKSPNLVKALPGYL